MVQNERELLAVAFPRLSDEQIQSLSRCSETGHARYEKGHTLIDYGDRNYSFFVIVSGAIEVQDHSGTRPKRVALHEAGAFTGDVNHVTGNPAIFRLVAHTDVEVLEISTSSLRQILNQHPEIGDLVLQAFIARRQLVRESGEFVGLRVIGSRYSQDTFRIREFLAKNRVVFTWLDLEADPEVAALLEHFHVTHQDTPIIACADKVILRNPSNRDLADEIGIHRPLEQAVYDLVIVGGGPAGLAAAVYGASEGLSTVVLERTAPGGQAGSSMRIENYLGFPTGITGAELADRAVLQASKFGVRLSVPTLVTRLCFDNKYAVLDLDDGETVVAKCLLIATGAEYLRLEVDGRERFEGRGVYYAATPNEAHQCRGNEVVLVGGGNSAGQAAVFLAAHAKRVTVVVRAENLEKSMSSYLARRIQQTPNIRVLVNTLVERLDGDTFLECVHLCSRDGLKKEKVVTPALFSFIGAKPRTEWLPPEIERDPDQFVRTGSALSSSAHWKLPRQPFLLETSHPGTFAVGDVRAGSVKRVGSAVGEGAMAVQLVHEYLKEM
jgi:thioredoxin reductase (NADPH)